jgi:ribosome-associated protein
VHTCTRNPVGRAYLHAELATSGPLAATTTRIRRRVLTPQDVAIACARIAHDLKAEDILILDLRTLTQITDYFVLATGASERQLKAIADKLQSDLKQQHVGKLGIEGDPVSGWVLLDYCDVVVHLFGPEARAFYELEMLWGDAPRIPW